MMDDHLSSACVVYSSVFLAVLKDIVMIPVRTGPWNPEKELDELYEVSLVVRDKWKTNVSRVITGP